MLGKQLIICVETNRQCKSDWMYIKSTIEQYYAINNSDIKLSPVYMNGKGNYKSNKVKKEVATLIKQYAAGTEKGSESHVIYAIDSDEYFANAEDAAFIKNVVKYCKGNNYELIWFCRDIEEVYLGKRIEKREKEREATAFLQNHRIKTIKSEILKSENVTLGRSNILLILDKYLL